MKVISKVLILLILSTCLGCYQPKYNRWKVNIINPNGKKFKTYTVLSPLEPKGKTQWGGQIKVYEDRGYEPCWGSRYKSLDIIVPTGWYFTTEIANEEKSF